MCIKHIPKVATATAIETAIANATRKSKPNCAHMDIPCESLSQNSAKLSNQTTLVISGFETNWGNCMDQQQA